ncbi:coiled-coil domain-containing protein 150 isoform X2 [Sarcophilus harrisii]|uniref:coiled-coil domain-containing protein 150 isoform X2 n=1 Tax=Sarcophilus harrisii TaxID=9305 RepID=UPI001301FD2E|nr:coiled-coil domain-containing protein 150 isoform X2 [Sarcophilus harrisii]
MSRTEERRAVVGMDLNIVPTARPVLFPVNINTTTPEASSVLQKRIRIAEKQSDILMNDLEMLGLGGQSFQTLSTIPLEDSENQKIIHPLQARVPYVEENNVLWKNCDSLVNRMCQLESTMQNLKAKISQLQIKKELNPQNSVYLKDQLNALPEEYSPDLREMHMEVTHLHKQLRDVKEEGDKAQDEVQRLSAVLEIVAATEMDATVDTERPKAKKHKMTHKIHQLREQLSQEKNLRESLESQAAMLCRVQDMETTVELEREQVKALQQDCLTLRKNVKITQEQLHQEQQETAQLENECAKLRTELRSKDDIISQLLEDGKTLRLSFSQEHKENNCLKSELASFRETARKVQVLNDHLNKQCSDLSNKLQIVTMENVRLIADHQTILKAEQEKVTQKLQEQDLMLDVTKASIVKELQNVQNERTQLQKHLNALYLEHSKCSQKAKEMEKRTTMQKQLQECTIIRLRSEREVALKERKSLLEGRENLLKELKKTQSDIIQEKSKFEMELKKNKQEISALTSTLQSLEKENGQLMNWKTAMEHQKVISENHEHTQKQVEKVLGEITDSKNKLAYEKGKLQTKVKQLQKEINSLADTRSENEDLHKLNKALETKYAQANLELTETKINLQKTKAQMKKMQSILEKNEDDFSRAIKSSDVSSRERHKMRGHLEALEDREMSKIENFQRQLAEAKEDNCKVTIMLENVLASHSKMQGALEKVQMELGRRDSEISGFKKERLINQQTVQKLEEELNEWQSRVLFVEAQHNSELEPLHNALDVSREDNRKLALSLEQALGTNSQLQKMLDHIQEKLDSKEIEQQTLENYRERVAEESKVQAEMNAERIDSLKKQFQSERETSRKAAQRETNELRKALDDANSRSVEVSRANRELRQKVAELEKSLAGLKEKLKNQKAQIRHYLSSKAQNVQNMERMKQIETELRQMELIKDQYQKKNYEQSLSIQKFVTEMATLQREMHILAKSQHDYSARNKQQELRLEAERKIRQELEGRCQEMEEIIRHLRKCKEATEHKLKEASVESEQVSQKHGHKKKITANLEEAHRWFKSKFDGLQLELTKNRLQQFPQEDRWKEDLTFANRNSRYNRAPAQSILHRWETKQQLRYMNKKYQSEMDRK